MIRPFTCVCFLLACGSGLYLYQSKHRVQVLDHEIEKTVHATDALREQTRVLHAEWTLLNDPQRLQALGDQFLSLKTVTPGQFTSMAELDNRLPAVRVPEPARPEVSPPVAETPETTQPVEPPPPAVAVIPPSPPKLPSVAVAVSQPHVVEQKPLPPRPMLAEVQPVRPAPSPSRAAIAPEPPRQLPPRITPVALPARLPSAPPVGSSLGMARGGAVPPPQPMPVSASQWVTNGGGG